MFVSFLYLLLATLNAKAGENLYCKPMENQNTAAVEGILSQDGTKTSANLVISLKNQGSDIYEILPPLSMEGRQGQNSIHLTEKSPSLVKAIHIDWQKSLAFIELQNGQRFQSRCALFPKVKKQAQ